MDRSTLVASVDVASRDISAIATLEQRAVRLPCVNCNAGWMSTLENDAARVLRRWLSGPHQRLTSAGVFHLSRWLVKTAIVLAFSESDARRFMRSPTETAIPDISAARAIADGQLPVLCRAGAARTNGTSLLWGTGNPTVLPKGKGKISGRAVNVTAVNLGTLQMWVALPIIIEPDTLRWPAGVAPLHANLRSGSLRTRVNSIDPTQVTAEYSQSTTEALFAAIAKAQGAAGDS